MTTMVREHPRRRICQPLNPAQSCPAPVQNDTDNVARREISEGVAAEAATEEAVEPALAAELPLSTQTDADDGQTAEKGGSGTDSTVVSRTGLDTAIERCRATQEIAGPVSSTKWSKKAFAVLAATLEFVYAFPNDKASLDKVRAAQKADGGRKRALNANNVPLIAIHFCQKPNDERDRKELSRFSSVVALAVHQKTKPDDAETWLRQRTLTDAVSEARALKGGENHTNGRIANPISNKKYPALATVLSTEGHPQQAQVNSRIHAFLAELNDRISFATPPEEVLECAQSTGDEAVGSATNA